MGYILVSYGYDPRQNEFDQLHYPLPKPRWRWACLLQVVVNFESFITTVSSLVMPLKAGSCLLNNVLENQKSVKQSCGKLAMSRWIAWNGTDIKVPSLGQIIRRSELNFLG